MRYFYTLKVQEVFVAWELGTMALLWFLTHDVLIALMPWVPFGLAHFWLSEYRPPYRGQIRNIRIEYWKTQRWDGKEWVDWEEYPPNKVVAV